MAAGCITTPAYTTNTERDHLHILQGLGRPGGDRLDAKARRPAASGDRSVRGSPNT
jgi:long-chain acyl-CoA synthetase